MDFILDIPEVCAITVSIPISVLVATLAYNKFKSEEEVEDEE